MQVREVHTATPELLEAIQRLLSQLSASAALPDMQALEALVRAKSSSLLIVRESDESGPIVAMGTLAPTGRRRACELSFKMWWWRPRFGVGASGRPCCAACWSLPGLRGRGALPSHPILGESLQIDSTCAWDSGDDVRIATSTAWSRGSQAGAGFRTWRPTVSLPFGACPGVRPDALNTLC